MARINTIFLPSLSSKSYYGNCERAEQETQVGSRGSGGMITCPSFAGYSGPRCIFIRCPEANGRYTYVERVASGEKKNLRIGPVVTTSQSTREEKNSKISCVRFALRSERHTEDSYLGSVSMYVSKKRNSAVEGID